MDWWIVLLLLLGGLLLLLIKGMPVAIAFLLVNFVAAIFLMGTLSGPRTMILSIYDSLTKFTLAPIPLFVIMGEMLFHSGLAIRTLDVLAKWLGSIPGRLSLLAAAGGTIFANLSGSTMANTAMLGSLLVPEMEKRGYHKSLIFGPILASGGLAMIIPPSALAVLFGSLAYISIGRLLIAGIIPGMVLAVLYIGNIIVRTILNPDLAPRYDVKPAPLGEKLFLLFRDVLPLGLLIFLVVGLIFLGVATPTEAAALGAFGAFFLVLVYGRFNFKVLRKSMEGTLSVTVMTFLIIAGSAGFSQILAYSGASRGLVNTVLSLPLEPIFILIAMQLLVLALGVFMEQVSIMMVTLPMYMPIVHALGFDPVWFGVLMLINLQIGLTTPPFGLLLFVMKGVAPKGTVMMDLYKAAIPFILCDVALMALIMLFPALALWLPSFL